jgi:hypothetical protein
MIRSEYRPPRCTLSRWKETSRSNDLNGRDRIGPSKAATSHATQIAAGLAREQLRDHLVDHVFGPPVTLCSVSRDVDGLLSLSVAIRRDPERTYSAWADAAQRNASVDQQLFFELSELSLRRYADCTRYHVELCFLLTSIARGETVELPAVLGATRFARPPSRLRWIRNHILRLVRR